MDKLLAENKFIAIEHKNAMSVDNSQLSANQVAQLILSHVR
jgi:hypothetical protein